MGGWVVSDGDGLARPLGSAQKPFIKRGHVIPFDVNPTLSHQEAENKPNPFDPLERPASVGGRTGAASS